MPTKVVVVTISRKDYASIVEATRRAFSRSELRYSVLQDALSKKKGPRGGKQYVCKKCGKSFGLRQIEVDHIKPVVPLNKTIHDMRISTIVNRRFCDKKNLQVLCKECHKVKTRKEASARTRYRMKRKRMENGRS